MSHHQSECLPYDSIPAAFRSDIRKWSEESRNGQYCHNQAMLHQSVAFFYADPRRPSMRQLFAKLCEMLDRDETLSGISLPRPSFPEFRKLVVSLPNQFVEYKRYGQWDTRDILSTPPSEYNSSNSVQ